jgi:IS5 family transposase
MQKEPGVEPSRGYSAIGRQYYGGYKLHVVTTQSGIIINYSLKQANAHDITELEELSALLPEASTLIGDGFTGVPLAPG